MKYADYISTSRTYLSTDSPFSYAALKGIDLDIQEGKVTAIIGETGSGKKYTGTAFKRLIAANGWRN